MIRVKEGIPYEDRILMPVIAPTVPIYAYFAQSSDEPVRSGQEPTVYVTRKQVVAIQPWNEWVPTEPAQMIVGSIMMVLMFDELYDPMQDEDFLGFGYKDEWNLDRWQSEIAEYRRRVARRKAEGRNASYAPNTVGLQ